MKSTAAHTKHENENEVKTELRIVFDSCFPVSHEYAG